MSVSVTAFQSVPFHLSAGGYVGSGGYPDSQIVLPSLAFCLRVLG